jgi:hypothetical protein
MTLSVFDLFRIDIGPSSSHTVGPIRVARSFALALEGMGLLEIWSVMQACVRRGCATEGILPGGLALTVLEAPLDFTVNLPEC